VTHCHILAFSNGYLTFAIKSCDVGIVVNPESLNEEISQKHIGSRPNSITVSFPSTQREVFEKLCPMVHYDDALKLTLELANLSRGKVGLRIVGLTTEINSDEQDIRADMNAYHGRGRNLKDLDIYELKTSGLDSGRSGLFQFHTFITWEAEVLACCHSITGATRIGNLIDYDISVIAERKQNILKSSMPFSVYRQHDKPLRRYTPPQDPSPKNRRSGLNSSAQSTGTVYLDEKSGIFDTR
jgi:hypothetical protein